MTKPCKYVRPAVRQPGEVHSIKGFCRNNGISVTSYFKLKQQGLHPREMKVGKRIVITPEAEAEWRHEREAEAETEWRRKREADATSNDHD